MNTQKRILVTGAAGSVGTTLHRAWEKRKDYELTCCDIRDSQNDNSSFKIADVRDYNQMKELCTEQDVLVHLAYVPQNHLGKQKDEISDINANILLFEAAREAGIQRIVFASTNHVTGMNEREMPARLSTGDQFRPDSWYGAMKGMAEIAGKYLTENYDMSFFSIRIGSYTGKDIADTLRTCSTLITPRDCIQLFTLAVDYSGSEKYLITYGTSGNYSSHHQSFLDITGAMEILGYQPQDNLLQKFGGQCLETLEKNK